MHNKRSRNPSLAVARPGSLGPMIVAQADHRIKNCVQLVASLMQLQATDDALARSNEALSIAAARINAVAHWHALRSKSQNGGRRTMALDGYLHAFADHFADVFSTQSRIVLLVNADPIKVPAHVAGMLGQIVNALVIDAVGRASGPKHPGTIQVECGTDADGTIVLQVRDERKGLGNGYGVRAPETFDMQIVTALVKQLGGRFAAPKLGARACYRVTIPMPGGASSASRKRQALRR